MDVELAEARPEGGRQLVLERRFGQFDVDDLQGGEQLEDVAHGQRFQPGEAGEAQRAGRVLAREVARRHVAAVEAAVDAILTRLHVSHGFSCMV